MAWIPREEVTMREGRALATGGTARVVDAVMMMMMMMSVVCDKTAGENGQVEEKQEDAKKEAVPVVVKIVDERSGQEELRGELAAYARLGWTPRPMLTPTSSASSYDGQCGGYVRGAYGLLEGLPNHMVLERMDASLFRVLDGGEERVERWLPTAASTVSVLLDVVEGLQALHAADVVHCDLRPANVLLLRRRHHHQQQRSSQSQSQSQHVTSTSKMSMPTMAKVADLGLAEHQGAELDPDYVSRRRGMVHLSADATATAALDMVGVGVMIIELIAARNLQSSADLRAAIQATDGDLAACCCNDMDDHPRGARPRLRCLRAMFARGGNLAAGLELMCLAKECLRADPIARPSTEDAYDRLLLVASLTTDAAAGAANI